MNLEATENVSLLAEILLTPSTETKTDRFSSENQANADCSGKCTGFCHGMK